MSAANDVKTPLTVLINREQTNVLLAADVDSDFIDILLSFMTLPLGKILGQFKKHYGNEAPVIGSLSNLYKSLAELDDGCFWTKEGKNMLLNPRSIFSDECSKLIYNLDDSPPTKYFYCASNCSSEPRTIAIYNIGNGKCKCGVLLNQEILVREPHAVLPDGVFTRRNMHNFTLSDDMKVRANAFGFMVENLHYFGVTDEVVGAESRTVHAGGSDIMDLLRGLLLSRTPLTDVFLKETQINDLVVTSNSDTPFHITSNATNSKKMIVIMMFQKSTDKFLFVQADDRFVDFLFSLLTISLGGVAHLLNGSTCLGSVDDLYQSIEILDSVHFKTTEIKTKLLEPSLPCMYLSDSQILPISGQIIELHYNGGAGKKYLSFDKDMSMFTVTIKDPKGNGCYVRSPGMFIVTDDLVVTPLSTLSFISHLKELQVTLSDVKEVKVEIGVEEALRILKASLTSTDVLTKALNPVLKKQPKQEKFV